MLTESGRGTRVLGTTAIVAVLLMPHELPARGGRGAGGNSAASGTGTRGNAAAAPSAATRGNPAPAGSYSRGDGFRNAPPGAYANVSRNPWPYSGPYPGGNYSRGPIGAAPPPPAYYSQPQSTALVASRSAPPPPTFTQPKSTPTVAKAPAVAAPLSYREAAVAHLYSLAKGAAWDMYENYRDAPTYASTYRELHKLLQSVKGVRTQVQGTSGRTPVSGRLQSQLLDLELALTAIRAEVAAWDADGQPGDDSRLHTQLQLMNVTLIALSSDLGLAHDRTPTPRAAEDAGETIRPRRAPAAALAPVPIGATATE